MTNDLMISSYDSLYRQDNDIVFLKI